MFLVDLHIPFYARHHGRHDQYRRSAPVIPPNAEGLGGLQRMSNLTRGRSSGVISSTDKPTESRCRHDLDFVGRYRKHRSRISKQRCPRTADFGLSTQRSFAPKSTPNQLPLPLPQAYLRLF
jgi:hypothetical protein